MITTFLQEVLKEDIGRGDLFEKCSKPIKASAKVMTKQDGILAGVKYVKEFDKIFCLKIDFLKLDGQKIKKGDIIATISGNNTDILKIERSFLNILQHASGIATKANSFSRLLKNSHIKILDTRKTRPLLRTFEKYSANCGGVTNHRLGLDDSLMLKDTHLKTIKNLKEFIKNARKKIPFTSKIEIECETPKQAEEALECGVEIIMCDNMNEADIKKVTILRDKISPSTLIEVSGNITEEKIKALSKLNVDAISSGSIVHQALWLDFSMKMDCV